MSQCSIEKGKMLYYEGDIGSIAYIIKSGRVEASSNSICMRTYNEWELFGDLALVHLSYRKENSQAKADTLLWCLEHSVINGFLRKYNADDYNEKEKLINSIQLLSLMDNSYRALLALNMTKEIYSKDAIILNEGSEVNSIYFIKEGNVSIVKPNNEELLSLEKGDYFGDKAVLTQTKISSIIKTTSYTVLYTLSISSLKQIIAHPFRDYLFANYLKYSFELSGIDIERSIIWKIYPCFKLKIYSKNEIVFRKGYAKNSALAIVIEGNIKNKQSNKYLPIQKGSIMFNDTLFEEEANGLSHETVLSSDLVADPDCLLLTSNVSEIEQTTRVNFVNFVEKCKLISSFRRIPMLMHLSIEKIEQLSEKVSIDTFKKNDIIIKEGEEGTKFFVIKYGKVDIYIKNRFLKTLNDYEHFGENNLFGNNRRTATGIVKSDSIILYIITKNNFQKIITEESLVNYLSQQIINQDTSIQLEDLDYVKTLNEDMINSIYLVQRRSDKQLFILKSIKKSTLNDYLFFLIENEKQMMLQLAHPFIIKMIKTLKDEHSLFFLFEFDGEMRLSDVLKKTGVLSKQDALFYIGSLLYCVQFLHKNSIIHRDIKPDNILIANNGLIKLFNFQTAKQIKGKTMTVIGSPHYMSPEEINGESYAFSADLWSIGVCFFEFLSGAMPFGGSSNDALEIYKSILIEDLSIPAEINDQECKSFLKSILHKNILKRLCSIELIKSHSLFSNFDWEGLINLNIKPPFIPVNNSEKRHYKSPSSLIHFLSLSCLKYGQGEDKCVQKSKMKELDRWMNSF